MCLSVALNAVAITAHEWPVVGNVLVVLGSIILVFTVIIGLWHNCFGKPEIYAPPGHRSAPVAQSSIFYDEDLGEEGDRQLLLLAAGRGC